ncbi:uncharacterized protein LOC125562956 [Nematostella vectensis]|uniref:uncharacterized protein LOC125562956 n=1 Tax=Nematostella vectensis TaxID=45351 RepID=UPI0020770D43|nr:uncharacterized protein LOC125562956 [Nematostella vectensis]
MQLSCIKKFKAKCELIFDGPLKSKSEEEKVKYLLLWSGDDGIETVSTWNLTNEEKKKLDTYWTKFEEFIAPKSNFRLSRFKLRTMRQEDDESVDKFMKRLRVLIQECKFTSPDEHLIDALIVGTNSDQVRSGLLKQASDLTINKAMDIARTEEATKKQIQGMNSPDNSEQIHSLSKKPNKHGRQGMSTPSNQKCGNCGLAHDLSKRQNCPAYNTKCNGCNKLHRWQRACRSKSTPNPPPRPDKWTSKSASKSKRQQLHLMEKAGPEPHEEYLYFHSLNVDVMSSRMELVTVEINTKPVVVKVDTAAEKSFPMTKTPRKEPDGNNAKEELVSDYKDCFDGIGCFEGEYHITLDETVPPAKHPPRRVQEALREPFKAELDSLCEKVIKEKVDTPTDWVNSFVCVTKSNGSIRLCLDPKDLNKAIRRPHYCTPTLDDDVFQKKVEETFGDLTGVTGIADDIVVVGFKDDGSDHDENLSAVIERAQATGIKFNPDSCRVKCTSIPLYGHILNANGLGVDPGKIEAITAMDPSTSVQDLQSFLGAVQYLSRFIPNLASSSAPLPDLTKSGSEFVWSPEHQTSVNSIKQAIAAPAALKYFSGKQPVTIQVDASAARPRSSTISGRGTCCVWQQTPHGDGTSLLEH